MNSKILNLKLGGKIAQITKKNYSCKHVQIIYLTQMHLSLPVDMCYMILPGHLHSIKTYLNHMFKTIKNYNGKFISLGKG